MSEFTRQDIEERIRKSVAEVLKINPTQIKSTSSFRDDLGADSLDTVSLLMALEEEFNQEISDEEAETLSTLDSTVDFVLTKLVAEA